MKATINKNAVFLELIRRVNENENGVRGYLTSAGIEVGEGEITVQDLNKLRTLNPDAFAEMIKFLYPELKSVANADDETTSKSGSKWGAGDWIGMVGTVLGGATSILGTLNINGNTNAVADANAYEALAAQEQAAAEKKQMRTTIIIVCVGFLVIVIAGVLIFKHRR